MSGKAFFIDTTRCTACRGCQVACKEWNQLPASKTINWGSHQNPGDLAANTWKLIRFTESTTPAGAVAWLFFADQCRHCVDPPCSYVPDKPGAIVVDKDTGAVIHTAKLSRFDFDSIVESCPFNIPRADPATNLFGKCTMCLDRVKAGMLPACVKTCPTGAMNFGDREKMAALAKERFEARKKTHDKAALSGLDDLRVFYLFDGEPSVYYEYAAP